MMVSADRPCLGRGSRLSGGAGDRPRERCRIVRGRRESVLTRAASAREEFIEREAESLPFADAMEAAYARLLERHGFERIETGQLVDTYARSKFEDTRRKAEKFGARGTTTKAYKPEAIPS